MIIQISSGQGPAECELAVGKLYDALEAEFEGMKLIEARKARTEGCFTSILFSSEEDMSFLAGTVQWICRSPFRPNHKRKNWFVDVSVIPEAEKINMDENIRWEVFRSPGKGGQHVNTTDSGVRLIHIPTGITVTSTAERSQFQNKKDALRKLQARLAEENQRAQAKQSNTAWQQHTQIVRGNPVRVYEGAAFKRKR
ncbi:peptide chain release factor H [Anaerovoracaceae bacterium 42-11]